jgi:hypothetical protein
MFQTTSLDSRDGKGMCSLILNALLALRFLTTALESRNGEQAATNRNQVFDQRKVEVWLA